MSFLFKTIARVRLSLETLDCGALRLDRIASIFTLCYFSGYDDASSRYVWESNTLDNSRMHTVYQIGVADYAQKQPT
jgi:hypothetical protein